MVQLICKPFVILLSISIITLSITATAHDGRHSQVLSKDDISQKAKKIVLMAIDKNKIDSSWSSIEVSEVKHITVNNSDEWKVKFTNNKMKEPKKNLYLFFTMDGEFIAMNYTGK